MIILISGKQRAGKDTLADGLMANARRFSKYDFKRTSFAKPIKEIHDAIRKTASPWFGIDLTKEPADKRLMQLIGTEWGRETKGPNVWIDCMKTGIDSELGKHKRMQELRDQVIKKKGIAPTDDYNLPEPLFVVTDCRFMNEFNAFPEALRIRINCHRDIRKSRDNDGTWRGGEKEFHISETDLDDYSEAGLFDLYLDSGELNKNAMVELTMAQILKASWLEKRGKHEEVKPGTSADKAEVEEV